MTDIMMSRHDSCLEMQSVDGLSAYIQILHRPRGCDTALQLQGAVPQAASMSTFRSFEASNSLVVHSKVRWDLIAWPGSRRSRNRTCATHVMIHRATLRRSFGHIGTPSVDHHRNIGRHSLTTRDELCKTRPLPWSVETLPRSYKMIRAYNAMCMWTGISIRIRWEFKDGQGSWR